MKDFKWARGLSRSTISNVLDSGAESVEFYINKRKQIVLCSIKRESDKAWGLAICSCLDEFDPKRGKNIAAGRAVLALTEKMCSRLVRYSCLRFPNTWTKKRIDHLKSFDGMPKCIYISSEVPDLGYMDPYVENKLLSNS